MSTLNKPQLKRLDAFVVERQRIWYRRTTMNAQRPWTQDKILQSYRFCNVFRELDTVTLWIDEHIRKPYATHPHLALMLCAARQINWPPTLKVLMDTPRAFFNSGSAWSPEVMRATMLKLKAHGQKIYTGAYMISGQRSNPDRTKADKPWITAHLTLEPLYADRKKLAVMLSNVSLQDAYDFLSTYNGFGGFMTGQVIADLKYTRYLRSAPDWFTWCALGPGSTRGLNRLYARRRDPTQPHKGRFKPLGLRWSAEEAAAALVPIRAALSNELAAQKRFIPDFLPKSWRGELCAQDTQNCLCEFDKYERARLGEGRPRTLYNGLQENLPCT